MKAGERSLSGRTALVTGASRGIGRACAIAIAGAGARVILLGRDTDALNAAVRECGADASAVEADLASAAGVHRAADEARLKANGPPDVIVNAAGQLHIAEIGGTDVETFERLLRVNLTAPFAIAREFLSGMRERGSGHVVTIGSLADHQALPGNAAYASSKFGLRALHEVMREELRGSGVRATLVSPEHVETAIWNDIDVAVPADRMMRPSAVADAVLFALTAAPGVNVDLIRLSRA